MKNHAILFYEKVTHLGPNNTVLGSIITKATNKQIAYANKLHSEGKCPHTIVKDEATYMYDFRSCATCGKGLGLV